MESYRLNVCVSPMQLDLEEELLELGVVQVFRGEHP